MVVVVDVNLAAVEVLQEFEDDIVGIVFDGHCGHFAFGHEGSEHCPELLALCCDYGLMRVDLFVFDFDCNIGEVLLVEEFVFEVSDVALADLFFNL